MTEDAWFGVTPEPVAKCVPVPDLYVESSLNPEAVR